MSTYRERRLARAERLRDYAASNAAKSDAAHASVLQIMDGIPLGQPILVGHHSEKRARADQRRIQDGSRKFVELADRAETQAASADEIERQADNAIYDDDPDAVERMTEKIAKLELERERRKAANVAYRKEHKDELKAMTPYERSQAVPYPSYSITNLGGNITRCRQRLVHLERIRRVAAGDAKPTYRRLYAKYGGTCDGCGGTIEKDSAIMYSRHAPDGEKIYHADTCFTDRAATVAS